MIANYHTHTWRCNHASGKEFEYVENAIEAGLKILGFSDHAPYIFPPTYAYPPGYSSSFRMELGQLEDYIQTVLDLRKDYGESIQIPLGLELEYYPDLLPQLLPILRDQPLDYVILGQHFLDNEINAHYSGRLTHDPALLERYTSQCIDAMQTGLFTYFAHPDLLHYEGDRNIYITQARRLCREAKSCDFPLEINLLGLRDGRHYPNPLFWEVAAEENCDVILGRDAHEPVALLQTKTEKRALELVNHYGLHLLQTVPLRKI